MFRTIGLLVVVMAVGCGDDAKSCPLPDGGVALTTVAALIGPAGGTLELAGGGKVEIPAGALASEVMISVTEVLDPKPLPLGMDQAGKAYAFEPHGTVFAQAVTVTVPFKDDDATAVRALKLDDDQDEKWQALLDVQKSADTISIETTSFSIYVAARPRRGSGVIVLPDGAIVLPGTDAGPMSDAAAGIDAGQDAATGIDAGQDAGIGIDAGQDAAIGVDGGCAVSDAGCPVGDITQLVAGYQHVCALYSLGAVYCWGASYDGETGQGLQGSPRPPGRVQLFTGVDLDDAVAISANSRGYHTCALRRDASVVCWGRNDLGQCGSDAPAAALRAYTVAGVTNAIAVSAGTSHSCAVLTSGAVQCWGSNSSGQLGIASLTPANTPTPQPMIELDNAGSPRAIADAVDVAAGQGHTCVVHSGRMQVSCVGQNSTGGGQIGMLGRGAVGAGPFTTADDAILPSATTVASIHIGSGYYASHTCVLAAGSRPICWGTNTYLQLTTTGGAVATPTQLDPYYSMPQSIALGSDFSCVSYVHANFGPRVACQGTNGSGQLGDSLSGVTADAVPDDVGTAMDRSSFLDGAGVDLMAAGGSFMCVKLTAGGVTCWGSNAGEAFGIAGADRTFAAVATLVPGLP